MADSYAEPRSRTETVVAIQYLRAIAAGLIVFQHAMGIPAFVHYAAHFGTVGVDLFFVISGYIMWTTTERRERGPVRILARAHRAHRAALLDLHRHLCGGCGDHAGELLSSCNLEAVHILKSFLFVPASHPTLGLALPVYTPGWTLNYEMFFYLLFGLLSVRAVAARALRTAGGGLSVAGGGRIDHSAGRRDCAHLHRSDHAGVSRGRDAGDPLAAAGAAAARLPASRCWPPPYSGSPSSMDLASFRSASFRTAFRP